MSQIPEYQQRVIDEHKDLRTKLEALLEYAKKDFPNASEHQKSLLKKQLVVMSVYEDILSSRILDFNSPSDEHPITLGEKIIGNFNPSGEQAVDMIKGLTTITIDYLDMFGKDPRRKAASATQFEYAQMMAVKSLFH